MTPTYAQYLVAETEEDQEVPARRLPKSAAPSKGAFLSDEEVFETEWRPHTPLEELVQIVFSELEKVQSLCFTCVLFDIFSISESISPL